MNAADGQPAKVVRVVDVRHEHLEEIIRDHGRRDLLENRVEKQREIPGGRIRIHGSETPAA